MHLDPFYTWLSLLGSLLTIAVVALSFWKWILPRLNIPRRYAWVDVSQALARAKHRVWVLQTWIPDLQISVDDWRKALDKDPAVDFRVLLLAPELVPYRLRGRYDERITGQTAFNVDQIRSLMKRYNTAGYSKIEARFYSVLPFGPVYILDDKVYWGIFTAHQDSLKTPAFAHSVKSQLGTTILASFERVWKVGSTSSGQDNIDLSITDGLDQREQSLEGVESLDTRTRVAHALSGFAGVMRPISAIAHAGRDGALVLVRNGITDVEKRGLIAGHLDVGINDDGRRQAQALSSVFREEEQDIVIWTSPLRRAVDTATFASPGLLAKIEALDQLRDQSLGDLEGHVVPASFTTPYIDPLSPPAFSRADDRAESFAEVVLRVEPVLQEALDRVKDGTSVYIFTHAAVIAAMASMLGSRPEDGSLDFGQARIYTEQRPHS